MAEQDSTMEHLSTENDEFGFDDNGLQSAVVLASGQEIVSSNCVSENGRDDSQVSKFESFPTGISEDESAEIAFDESKSSREEGDKDFHEDKETISLVVLSGTVDVTINKESKRHIPNDGKDSKGSIDQEATLDLPVGHIYSKEGVDKVEARSAIGWGQVEAEEAKVQSARFPKDAGFSKSSTNLEVLLSLASFLATSFATISWQLSVTLTVGIILLMPSVGVEGALTSVPVNTLVVVGKTARINCSTNLNRPVYWARTQAGSDAQQWLYYGKNGFNGNNADNRFSMDKDEATGRYDVIIAEVQPKDAGQYVCVDESGIGARASAELVVSDPVKCNSRIPSDGIMEFMGDNVFGLEQDFIQISCGLTYTGNLAVTLEWSWPGSKAESGESVSTATTSSVASTLKLSPVKEYNNVKFQCRAKTEGVAQHTIDSGLLWESDTVIVRYAEFEAKAVEDCPGVEWNLICNPQCSYYLERKGDDCQCLYTYYDNRTQQKYQVTSDTVSCGKNNTDLLDILIAVASVAAFSVATVIVLVYCLQKNQRKRWPIDDSTESGHNGNVHKSSKAMLEKIVVNP